MNISLRGGYSANIIWQNQIFFCENFFFGTWSSGPFQLKFGPKVPFGVFDAAIMDHFLTRLELCKLGLR